MSLCVKILPLITPPLMCRGAAFMKSTMTFAAGLGSLPRNARAVGPSSIAEASGRPASFMAMRAKLLRTTR